MSCDLVSSESVLATSFIPSIGGGGGGGPAIGTTGKDGGGGGGGGNIVFAGAAVDGGGGRDGNGRLKQNITSIFILVIRQPFFKSNSTKNMKLKKMLNHPSTTG